MATVTKPNCYECQHRREVPGDAHSSCAHPNTGLDKEKPLDAVMAIFASVGRVSPKIGQSAIVLGISGDPHGIRRGWFNWPWNFDPTWLQTCLGFTAKEKK